MVSHAGSLTVTATFDSGGESRLTNSSRFGSIAQRAALLPTNTSTIETTIRQTTGPKTSSFSPRRTTWHSTPWSGHGSTDSELRATTAPACPPSTSLDSTESILRPSRGVCVPLVWRCGPSLSRLGLKWTNSPSSDFTTKDCAPSQSATGSALAVRSSFASSANTDANRTPLAVLPESDKPRNRAARCGAWMPQAKEPCARIAGHRDSHRTRFALDNDRDPTWTRR